MPGHFDFGYHINIPICGIFNYFTNLILGIKSAVRCVVKLLRGTVVVITDNGLCPLATYVGSPGTELEFAL